MTLKTLLGVIAAGLLAMVTLTATPTSAAGATSYKPERRGQARLIRTVQLTAQSNAQTHQITSKNQIRKQISHHRGGHTVRNQQNGLTDPQVSGNDFASSNPNKTGMKGLNEFQQSGASGFALEPPDQALCASQGWIVEAVNLAIRVDRTTMTPFSGVQYLNTFFGVPSDDFTSDPTCYFDADTNRWFVNMLDVPATFDQSFDLLAVSATPNPIGPWNVYAIDTTDDGTNGTPSHPNCPCIGDYPKIGADRNALIITTDEFSLADFSAPCTCAQIYVLDKAGLAQGFSFVNLVQFNTGLVPFPDPGGAWFALAPATSPSAADFDDRKGGVAYLLSGLDFDGWSSDPTPPHVVSRDNRIAIWGITNTKSLAGFSPDPAIWLLIHKTEVYSNPPAAVQKDGPHPLGEAFGQPVGPIQTNDDSMHQTVYANGLLAGALTSAVRVPSPNARKRHAGVAWFMFRPSWQGGPLSATIYRQGYIAAKSNDIYFPSVALTHSGKGAMVFTLSGNDNFPSAAYISFNESGMPIHLAAKGAGPADGFTEYAAVFPEACTPPDGFCPRWGDYSETAVFGETIYIATEYIASKCTLNEYLQDPACGGKRDTFANWGTHIDKLSP